ncbi:MAG: Acetylornithine transaminase, partial [Clostridiales bacterium]|nr:Acetylornithine transaminase [Clostridiales bacterium]
MEETIFTLDDIESFSAIKVAEMHKKYLNKGLVALQSLIKFDKVYNRAENCILTDVDGNEYLDFLGGYGALNLGHNHPRIVEALSKVVQKPNILQTGLNPYAAALAQNLSILNDRVLQRSFFCNSGAEAVEGALKLAKAASRKSRIVYCRNSFHGKTYGALSVTGREKYRKCFKPLLPDCDEVPFGEVEALEQALQRKDAAAFIVEPIQGEGGVNVPNEGYLQRVRELCTYYETFLIIDEIQTGFGRTGRMFAYQHESIHPDILCMAKSLGGGIMPIGAYITTDTIYQKAYGGMEKCLLHTSTFGGNTYACAAALAAIEVLISERLVQQAEEKGQYLLNKLIKLKNKYRNIKEVRGKGLLIGLEFNNKDSSLINA